MRINLVDLMRQREICHPSEVIDFQASDGTARLRAKGYPWWLETSATSRDATIEFEFAGITEARIDENWLRLDPDAESLEDFNVQLLSELQWASQRCVSVYCAAALPDPLRLYAVVHEFLINVDCPFSPDRFLNCADHLSRFCEIASSRSFLLCSGPEAICQPAINELEQLGVPYSIIENSIRKNDEILVRLGNGYIFCQTASAAFES